MTDREKLIAILSTEIYPREGADPAEVAADYLLDSGVVPVVRCEECKYGGRCTFADPNWYCADGERRDDDEHA